MKKHLRLIKERKENKEVAVDLRGLGNEKVFKHFYPTSVLTEKNKATHEMLQDCERLNISHSYSESNQVTHYTCNHKGLSHKEQALQLFLLASKHSNDNAKHLDQRFYLWETPTFRTLMHNALNGHPEKEIPTPDEFWTELQLEHKHYMTLEASSALHIHQAEIHIESSTSENVHLTREKCFYCYEQEIKKLNSSAQQESFLKAGAK